MLPLQPAKGTSWEVKSRSTACLATEKEFKEGETILSRLVNTKEGMLREDYCQEAWSQELKKDALFYWKTKFRLPPPKKEEAFKEENAEEFLREMITRNDPSLMNTLFILAVLLERKRLLIERGVQRNPDGQPVRIYEHKDSGETFFILDPELSLDQVADVQEEVALALGWIQPDVEEKVIEEADAEEEIVEDTEAKKEEDEEKPEA
jgi:hypothetical protein